MEQTVIEEVLGALHTTSVVILGIVELDLALGCFDVGYQVHQMSLLKPCLILHVGANALNWREVAQISILGESGGKSALRPIEELWERQLVFWLL